jgi:hypothetical protein
MLKLNTTDLPACVTSTGKADHLTDRYQKIHTMDVLNILADEGWGVASVKADRPSVRDPRFVRHMIDLRHPDLPKADDGSVARILFINSHNGRTQAHFRAGIYRFICSNGLVIGTDVAHATVRHTGTDAAEIVRRIQETSKATTEAISSIARWSKVKMSKAKQLEFATAAAELRFEDPQKYDPALLLTPKRHEDEGSDLWSVFNRVQEHGTQTRLEGRSVNGRRVVSRGIGGIAQSLEFNAGLWKLAAEFAKA